MLNKIYEKIKNYIVENYKFLLSLVAIILFFTIELPYVIYTPGGIVELNDRIVVEDGYDYDGTLNMSYVSMIKGKIPFLFLSLFIDNWDVVKDEEITADNQSVNELIEMEKIYMESSINFATIVAYNKAGKTIDIKDSVVNVVYLTEESNTTLKVGDKVISIDGTPTTNFNETTDIIQSKKEGETIHIIVDRDGKEVETKSVIYNTEDGLKIGVVLLLTYDYDTDPSIEVKTKSQESGSSGGLMLTLAIYNTLTEEDITHGKKIVGTGTINTDGTVGEIDGVKYKLLGADKNEADLFFCPMENYEEAKSVKEEFDLDLEIVGVNTFDEALEYLETYK